MGSARFGEAIRMNPGHGMGVVCDEMGAMICAGVPTLRDRDIFAERLTRDSCTGSMVTSRQSRMPISVIAVPVRVEVAPAGCGT